MTSRLFEQTIYHPGLGKRRAIKAETPALVAQMAQVQMGLWEVEYQHRLEKEQAVLARQAALQTREERKARAAELTAGAQQAVAEVNGILKNGLARKLSFDWTSLKDSKPFGEPKPTIRPVPPPAIRPVPTPPDPGHPSFRPKFGLLDLFSKARKESKVEQARKHYEREVTHWTTAKGAMEAANEKAMAVHKTELSKAQTEQRAAFENWLGAEAAYLEQQRENNALIDRIAAAYKESEMEAVKFYCENLLAKSHYPESFPFECEFGYEPDGKVLTVDYRLPVPGNLPKVKEVKYVQTRDSIEEVALSQASSNELYDKALYQITLRTIHELFEADDVSAIEAICFNGWVRFIDPAVGTEVVSYILTVLAKRNEFQAINLSNVDPKECFRKLKGISASKLSSLAPVAPVIQLNRSDHRFVEAHGVVQNVNEGTNLAAMPWEDFEHLVREIFEAVFSADGGEVKVTQASRDGGVDAIAFDPDPIRGGKIVIQAKRYTNVVGVSAVRDLYGTVMNEGAIKGILVTTSSYGPDAYQFARDKPLALLNGSNLLSLLEKHGHKARIDLAEARKLMVG